MNTRNINGRFIKGHSLMKGKRLVPYNLFTCPECGLKKEFPQSIKRKYCSRDCMGKNRKKGQEAAHWKGGKTIHNGYIRIFKPDHPFADRKGYIFEHRLNVEGRIGRFLEPHEVIHHINYDKTDNRPQNLMILTREEHINIHKPPHV